MMRPLTDVVKKVPSNHVCEALWADDRRLTEQARDTSRLFNKGSLFDDVRYGTEYDRTEQEESASGNS
jgi:hypothetical protein